MFYEFIKILSRLLKSFRTPKSLVSNLNLTTFIKQEMQTDKAKEEEKKPIAKLSIKELKAMHQTSQFLHFAEPRYGVNIAGKEN